MGWRRRVLGVALEGVWAGDFMVETLLDVGAVNYGAWCCVLCCLAGWPGACRSLRAYILANDLK